MLEAFEFEVVIKGTVGRDFYALVFFNKLSPGPIRDVLGPFCF